MQAHDWITATLSAIAIAISVYNLVSAKLAARRAARREVDQRWRLEIAVVEGGYNAAYITYAGSPEIRFISVAAAKPRGG